MSASPHRSRPRTTRSCGASVEWDGATRSIIVTKDSTVIRCSVGSAAFTVNGTTRYSDAAPEIRNGRTMLPIRPIAEALGGTLQWDGYTASVTIDTPAADAPAPTLPGDIPDEVRWLVEKYYVPADGQGNGSWRCLNGEGVYDAQYLFTSEMADGTRQAVEIGYRRDNGVFSGIGVDSFPVTTSGNGFQLKDGWPPFYWNGLGIGGGPTFDLEDYVYTGEDIRQIGFQTYFSNGYDSPVKYGPYEYTGQDWSAV